MRRKPHVVSISAVSGGGKTTATNHLIQRLSNSKAIYFDDYDFEEGPTDICEWVDRGANYNEWNLRPLITDIQLHLSDQYQPLEYIVIDYPFAYLNNEMSKLIDFAIYIDTPLDIAMARRLMRDFTSGSINDVQKDLNHYLSRGRKAYLEMVRSVKPISDVVIDGSLPVTLIVDCIIQELRNAGLCGDYFSNEWN